MKKRARQTISRRPAAARPPGVPVGVAPPGKVAYFNRELSWLAFNRRVLDQAQNPRHPLLERVRFLTIFSSNLDEFFEIRVAGLIQQVENEVTEPSVDGLGPREQLRRIHSVVASLVEDQFRCWHEQLEVFRLPLHRPVDAVPAAGVVEEDHEQARFPSVNRQTRTSTGQDHLRLGLGLAGHDLDSSLIALPIIQQPLQQPASKHTITVT